nr:hypothetical protein SPACI_40960 [Sporomusa acidovorans DSM 3132]
MGSNPAALVAQALARNVDITVAAYEAGTILQAFRYCYFRMTSVEINDFAAGISE